MILFHPLADSPRVGALEVRGKLSPAIFFTPQQAKALVKKAPK